MGTPDILQLDVRTLRAVLVTLNRDLDGLCLREDASVDTSPSNAAADTIRDAIRELNEVQNADGWSKRNALESVQVLLTATLNALDRLQPENYTESQMHKERVFVSYGRSSSNPLPTEFGHLNDRSVIEIVRGLRRRVREETTETQKQTQKRTQAQTQRRRR